MTDLALARAALMRRGLLLNYLTIGYNVVEAIVSIAAGLVSGSVALVSFGRIAESRLRRAWPPTGGSVPISTRTAESGSNG